MFDLRQFPTFAEIIDRSDYESLLSTYFGHYSHIVGNFQLDRLS